MEMWYYRFVQGIIASAVQNFFLAIEAFFKNFITFHELYILRDSIYPIKLITPGKCLSLDRIHTGEI